MSARSETLFLVARQIATFNGQIFDKLDMRKRAATLTLAENILATVERKLRAEDNCLLDHLSEWQ